MGAPSRPGVLWVLLLASLFPAALRAQGASETPSDPGWLATVSYQREFPDSDLPQWTDWSVSQLSLVRDFNTGALGVEAFRAERFGLTDEGFAVDAYRTLWAGAYANVRLRVTPDARILPAVDGRAELFQSLRGGWELSGSWWKMGFDMEDVDVFGAGIARYTGNWYIREVTSVSRLAGTSSVSVALQARRFLASPREFVELGGGVGREAVVLGPGPAVETRDTRFVQFRAQRFLGGRWGISGGVTYNGFEGAPHRVGGSAGLMVRF